MGVLVRQWHAHRLPASYTQGPESMELLLLDYYTAQSLLLTAKYAQIKDILSAAGTSRHDVRGYGVPTKRTAPHRARPHQPLAGTALDC